MSSRPLTGRRRVIKVVGFHPASPSVRMEMSCKYLQSNLAATDGRDSGTRCRDKHQLSPPYIYLSGGTHVEPAFVLSCSPCSFPLLGTRQERQRPVLDNHTIDYWFILNLWVVQLRKWSLLLFFLLPVSKGVLSAPAN
jgi:hypothetical protein